jgi:hypothetical protein
VGSVDLVFRAAAVNRPSARRIRHSDMDIRGYIRQARTLPFDATLRKAIALAGRTGRARFQLAADIFGGSYGTKESSLDPAARIAIVAAEIPADLTATLRHLGQEYLQHRFDLLGSGRLSPVYGFVPKGFLGHRYRTQAPAAPARDGGGLEAVVNRANVPRARRIWRLIARPDYVPIDWQLDFRSGYRWSARRPSRRLPIPVDAGADIKVPWELARLQHLPQLALCAILAKAGTSGFAPAARYVGEIADQLGDFIATNPPRFGVNWIGIMDVAIRAANIALTLALLAGANLSLSPAMSKVVASALHDHATHIADHLEYSEVDRSNHYLGDLGGLLWTGWLLTGADADRFLIFAVAEMLKEADHQFLPDGGNYEGSTNYHRLSGEIVVFALAVIASLDASALKRLERATPPARAWRAEFPLPPLHRHREVSSGAGIIALDLVQKMHGSARLTRAVQGADNTIVQIGDTDSGRFFNLHPTPLTHGEGVFVENTLDHRGFVAAVDALSGAARGESMDAILVERLVGVDGIKAPSAVPVLADFGDLDALMARWEAAPDNTRRVRRVLVRATTEGWARAAFPDFGLYVFRQRDLLITFRCASKAPKGAPRGHRHDDNLSIEYRLGHAERRDPGSFVYTPSVARRNEYRAASAHDAPRIRGASLVKTGAGLFDLDELAPAQCLYWREDGVAGEVRGPSGTMLRIICLSTDEFAIFDCVTGGEIADVPPPMPVARGYGRL